VIDADDCVRTVDLHTFFFMYLSSRRNILHICENLAGRTQYERPIPNL